MFRGLMYGSYKKPRELVWLLGMVIYLVLMAEAFMGYVLPWGQMSFWGAKVIISLFGAIPVIGNGLTEWIMGDYIPSDATLNRFFALHVIALPLVLLLLVVLHLGALHEVGSNNPDGVEIKKGPKGNRWSTTAPTDGIPFHPYYTVKDLVGVGFFLILAAFIIFFAPTFGGWFLEHDNFTEANPLVTPQHIKPVWYFTPYYAMLRVVPSFLGIKLWGVLVMFGAIVLLFLVPWLDKSKVKSYRYRGKLSWLMLGMFVVSFLWLMKIGAGPGTDPVETIIGRVLTFLYYAFFITMPLWTKLDRTKPVPERVTTHD
jgi:ubiquinol-cytochrome c reductase cytochrome b subunit